MDGEEDMFKTISAIALLCTTAVPAVGLECTFGKDSFGHESIFRAMSVSGDAGMVTTNRGKQRDLDCIGAEGPDGVVSCVFHFPDGEGAYIYALSPDRSALIFTAYAPGETAPSTWNEAICTE